MKAMNQGERDQLYYAFDFYYGGGHKCEVDDCSEESFLQTQVFIGSTENTEFLWVKSNLCLYHFWTIVENLEKKSSIKPSVKLHRKKCPYYLKEKLIIDTEKITPSLTYYYPVSQICMLRSCKSDAFWGMKIRMEAEDETIAFFTVSICRECLIKVRRFVQEKKQRWQGCIKNANQSSKDTFMLQ